MSVPQLLSTTSLISQPNLTLVELRACAVGYVTQGRAKEAISFLSYLFFETGFSTEPDSKKQYLLKSVWRIIARYYTVYFEYEVEESITAVQDATDAEWAHDLVDLSREIAEDTKAALIQKFELAVNLGKAAATAELLYTGSTAINEVSMEELAKLLE
jgi:hypothetical protein